MLFGCLLPFHNGAVGWSSDTFNPDLRGPIGLWTVGGSVAAFCAVLSIGAQMYCMRWRKIMIKPVLLMLGVAAWSWITVIRAFSVGDQFAGGGHSPMALVKANKDYFVDIWRHIGPGHLFILGGLDLRRPGVRTGPRGRRLQHQEQRQGAGEGVVGEGWQWACARPSPLSRFPGRCR